MFTNNPLAFSASIQISGVLILVLLYCCRPPKKGHFYIFVGGWICLGIRLGMDMLNFPFMAFGPKGHIVFSILSTFAVLPLPKLIGKHSSGRIISSVFGVVLIFFISIDPIFHLISGAKLAKLNGIRGPGRIVIWQSTAYTCVPSCVASILTDFGHPMTEGEAAIQLHTSNRGTNFTRVWYFLSHHQANLELQKIRLSKVDWSEPWVSMVNVRVKPANNPQGRDISHAILVYPGEKGNLSVGDPLKEYGKDYTLEQFKKTYRPMGGVIQVRKQDGTIPPNPMKVHQRSQTK